MNEDILKGKWKEIKRGIKDRGSYRYSVIE